MPKIIKLTLEKNPSKFLDTKLLTIEYMKLKYNEKKQRYQRIGVLASLAGIREMQFQYIYIGQSEYRQTLIWKFKS